MESQMKNALAVLAMTFALVAPSFASEEQAAVLFTKRGENAAYAQQAAAHYAQLAQAEADVLKRAQLKTNEAEATYYYGTKVNDRDSKMDVHDKGQKAAMVAVGLLSSAPGVPARPEFTVSLARAYYFYGANLGKWGEAKGVLASLGRWPELKENMFHIVNLGAEAQKVEDFGVFRVLGRAYMKVPYESSAQGLDFLKKANQGTQVSVKGITLSKNSTNVVYFLDILKKQDEIDLFCEQYAKFAKVSKFVETDLVAYNSERVPETKTDVSEFNANSDLHKYAKKECQ